MFNLFTLFPYSDLRIRLLKNQLQHQQQLWLIALETSILERLNHLPWGEARRQWGNRIIVLKV